jgi:hypothetical protein
MDIRPVDNCQHLKESAAYFQGNRGNEFLQNIARVTLYSRIREVLGLNLGQDTGQSNLGYLMVYISPSRKIPE